LSDLDGGITDISGEARELNFLHQRISMFVQRFKAVLHDSLLAAATVSVAVF